MNFDLKPKRLSVFWVMVAWQVLCVTVSLINLILPTAPQSKVYVGGFSLAGSITVAIYIGVLLYTGERK